jgi:hypothetical protein
MDGLARITTKKYQPSVFPVPSKVIKGQDCDLKGPNPNQQVSIDQDG